MIGLNPLLSLFCKIAYMTRHQTFPPVHNDPETRIRLIFSAQAARGGIVRRSIAWVDREGGRERFFDEVRRRGFRLLASSNQFIVICNRDPVQVLF